MSWTPVTYKDIWADDLRLVIDGVDVTYFRGVNTQFGGYQLQQPYGYGPAGFSFPQITELEVDRLGEPGPLKWLRKGALARLIPVTGGIRAHDVWRGILTIPQVSGRTVQVHCDGEASGRLALRDRHAAVFALRKDVTLFLFDAMEHVGLECVPNLGLDSGIISENRGGGTDYLTWVNDHLANAVTDDLEQYTIMPAWVDGRHLYRIRLKDTDTIDATVFLGAEGVELDVTSDIQEEPNAWYGSGTNPAGQKWNNAVAPGIVQGDPPPFPGVLSVGDSGPSVSLLHARLISRYLTREDATPDFDGETADAVKDLQEDAGLPETGVVDEPTWNALFDLSVTGMNIRQATILPLAEATQVRRHNRTSSGALSSRNTGYDPDVLPVDITIDHGAGVKKSRAVHWSKRQLRRTRAGKNWVGTLTLDGADVFAGNVTRATADPTSMSRLDLRAGANIMVRDFHSDTVFHVAGVNVDGDRGVRLAVDTKYRDLHTIGEIIARNKESRRNPAREWVQAFRGRSHDNQIIWSEIGGIVFQPIALAANTWNVFEVPAGLSGTIERLRIQLDDATCEFVMGVAAFELHAGMLNRDVGNPFDQIDGDGVDQANWVKPSVQRMLKRDHLMLYTAGQSEQPCGYSPGSILNRKGNPSGDPITGEHEDDAGINFHTFAAPVLYVAIYPRNDCVVQPGRVFWHLETEGS